MELDELETLEFLQRKYIINNNNNKKKIIEIRIGYLLSTYFIYYAYRYYLAGNIVCIFSYIYRHSSSQLYSHVTTQYRIAPTSQIYLH